MSVTSGFFNSLSGDRKYDAIQISSMFDGLITDGIYNGFLESFMVTASSPASMVVTVGEGRCWFNHTWTLNDAPLPLTLDVGDVVLNRIDTIVIDVDSTDTVRACTIKVVKGSPSSQAVRPTLENTETHHQYPLCDISVPAGATTVTQSNITNRRGTSDCPFVATLMESVDVDDLLIQWESQWNDWMTDRADAMDSWTAEQKEAFTTWFQTVQDILDENTAGNLLNRINHRTGINATATYSAGVVAITAPDDAGEILTFVAPSDFLSTDTYTLNGEALTITDLNGEALDEAWKKNSPVTITVSGGKAFFKAGGSGKNDTLPPLLGNMTVEVVEGDENDTYTIKMDKLILDKTTEMVGGAQLEWGEEMPAKPGKGTGGIKTWTRDEIITTGKPYDGLYLGDATLADGTYDLVPEDPALSGTTKSISVMAETPTGTPIQLKDVPVSNASIKTTIYLKENGEDKPFLYLDADYETSGRGLLLKESVVNQRVVQGSALYESSNMHQACLNWFDTLDNAVKSKVEPVTITYRWRSGSSGYVTKTMEATAFLLTMVNYGYPITPNAYPGKPLPYFNGNGRRQAFIDGTQTISNYYTRDIETYNSASYYWYGCVKADGTIGVLEYNGSYYIRPAITLPPDVWLLDNGDGTYTFVGDKPVSSEFVSHTIEVPHGQKVVFRQFTQNQKKQFQTMLVGGVYPPLGDVEPPFALPEFTGNHAIFGDETAGRIELYESGDLTLYPGTYDFFLVGGGSGAPYTPSDSSQVGGSGGGAGGFTYTEKGFVVERESAINVVVGAGGTSGTAGSPSTVDLISKILTANGGTDESAPAWDGQTDYKHTNGFNGGSGGGARSGQESSRGDGGSDGGDGVSSTQGRVRSYAGTGQGKTTRAFEEPEMTLYAGGGGGGAYPGATPGKGGAGGGGDGASNGTGKSGTPNTGGGGGSSGKGYGGIAGAAGGSGIVIIRWNNATAA